MHACAELDVLVRIFGLGLDVVEVVAVDEAEQDAVDETVEDLDALQLFLSDGRGLQVLCGLDFGVFPRLVELGQRQEAAVDYTAVRAVAGRVAFLLELHVDLAVVPRELVALVLREDLVLREQLPVNLVDLNLFFRSVMILERRVVFACKVQGRNIYEFLHIYICL